VHVGSVAEGYPEMRTRILLTVVLAAGLIVAIGTLSASANGSTAGAARPTSLYSKVSNLIGIGDDQTRVAPGALDDGKNLLPQATITLDDAIKAAKESQSGSLGEVDLEYFKGHLVFNVDIGDHDVKVDAANGDVLSANANN
jgi:uncharacterized membrane protein YkoI